MSPKNTEMIGEHYTSDEEKHYLESQQCFVCCDDKPLAKMWGKNLCLDCQATQKGQPLEYISRMMYIYFQARIDEMISNAKEENKRELGESLMSFSNDLYNLQERFEKE